MFNAWRLGGAFGAPWVYETDGGTVELVPLRSMSFSVRVTTSVQATAGINQVMSYDSAVVQEKGFIVRIGKQ